MKKILLTLVLIIPLALAGCKKTDTGTNPGGGDGDGGQNPPTEEVTLDGYVEPITQFGISIHQLKALETHILKSEDEDSLTYNGEDMVDLYMYLLDDTYSLAGSGAAVSTIYASVMGSFLAEKYLPLMVNEDEFTVYYLSKDLSMMVAVQVASVSTLLVMYVPYGGGSNSAASINSLPQMFGGAAPCDGDCMAIFEEMVDASGMSEYIK